MVVRFILLFGLLAITWVSMAQVVSRTPYLQNLTSTGITIRWRTDQPTDSRIRFGTTVNQLNQQTIDPTLTTEHSVRLTGLQTYTQYFYAVGTSAGDLMAGSDQYFRTFPLAGTKGPFRIWALGDFGNGSINQLNVFQQYRQVAQTHPADLWLWLGDNAYSQGFDSQYQQNVFTIYADVLKNLPLWSTPGNHEYADTPNNLTIDYFKLIDVPQQAEAGGVPSGSKMNYSFNYANVHIVSLDSEGQDDKRLYDTTGRQVQWLKSDLAANRQPWTIVFFHHPPYSKGPRDSDYFTDQTLIRQQLTPILERYNVDLVLCGHSHVYERSYLMKGHTGLSNTFNVNQYALSTSTARYDGSNNSCPIINKKAGTIYVVSGSGGQLGGQAPGYPHPAMIYSNNTIGGSMIIDVTDNRLDVQWLTTDGTAKDQFTLFKNVSQRHYFLTSPGASLSLTASWPGNYTWNSGQTGRTVNVAPTTTTTYTVNDQFGCLTDIFTVDVDNATDTNVTFDGQLVVDTDSDKLSATIHASMPAAQPIDIHITDSQGLVVFEKQYPNATLADEVISFPATGQYWLTARVGPQLIGRISFSL